MSVQTAVPTYTVDQTTGYQFTFQLNPITGDFAFNDATFVAGSPMLEVVGFYCRTVKGRFMPDTTIGPNYSLLDKSDTQTANRWRAEIKSALDPLVKLRLISDVVVAADPPVNNRLNWQVTFTDPALPGPNNRFTFPPRV